MDSGGKKAGKGALIQEEKSATLGVSQDQILFQAVKSIGFMRNLGGVQTMNEKMPTLQAANGMSGNNKPCVCSAGFKPNQGAKAKGVGYEKEKCPTLLAGQEPAVCISFEPGIASRDGGHVYENVSGTLRATPGDNQMTVVLENHPNDSRVKIDDSGTVQTLTSRCGTGGGNVPMVLEPVCFQQNQREEVRIMDVLGAITAESGMHNTNYVVFSKIRRAKTADDFETWGETGVCNTLNTFDNGDVRTNECVICLQGNGIDRADTAGCNGKGWKEDVPYTLNTIDRPAVVYSLETFHCTTDDKAQPIKARDYKDPLVICYEKTKK